MAGRTPEETDRMMNDAISSGDAEAAVALFEADGVLVLPGAGEARGRDAIREAVREFLAMRPSLGGRLRQVVIANDVALLLVEWRMEATAPDGEALVEQGVAADVMRRQADGTWRYVIDLPHGGEAAARP